MGKSLLSNYSIEDIANIVKNSTSLKEVVLKLGYSSNNGNNSKTDKDYLDRNNISYSHFTGKTNSVVRTEDNVFCKDSTASQATLRRWYIRGQYTKYECSICGLPPVWNGKELTLTLDHIDGDNHNNELSNLRWVCPNCDRQLPTFGFKRGTRKINKDSLYFKEQENRGTRDSHNFCIDCGIEISLKATRCTKCQSLSRRTTERPSPEQLEEELRQTNFTQVGRKYSVTDNTIRKWCKAYGMSTHSSDYK